MKKKLDKKSKMTTYLPKINEVHDGGTNNVEAVENSPEKKYHKVLVVMETDTVVDPEN